MASEKQQSFPDISEVYEQYEALTAGLAEAGGSLIVYAGLDLPGIALAVAANIAGAASLGLEDDVARAKAAIRSGACDFLVNSLDEALRILKNEIRKKNPVAVALVGEPRAIVAEMVERGVQPEMVAGGVPGLEILEGRGARRVGTAPMWGVAVRWTPEADRQAAEALDPAAKSAAARRRWVEAAPRYLGRALGGKRYLRMSEAEAERFVEALKRAGISVTVKRDGAELVIAPAS
ncbi:MAG: hypothetical protein JOZ83_12515 [Silvibacterium sp.]|nr:hypothetical protein [Silvibacterium sp.]